MATITEILSIDLISDSRTDINNNFTNLNTDKIEADSVDTLINKTIDADGTGNSITNLENENIKVAAAIDATKIADGSVTNAEFQYIGGVTSDIQTQIDGKSPTAGSGSLVTVGTVTSGNVDAVVSAASTTTAGKVELDTTAEIDTGTDSTRAMPVDQFVASKRNIRWLTFNLVEAGTDCAVATNIAGDFVSPIAGTILQSDTTPFYIYATNSTAGVTGTMVVDVSINGTSIMTTNKLDFDTTEKTTTTAATPPDLTTTSLAVGDIVTIDIDSIHTTPAKGLTVYIGIRE